MLRTLALQATASIRSPSSPNLIKKCYNATRSSSYSTDESASVTASNLSQSAESAQANPTPKAGAAEDINSNLNQKIERIPIEQPAMTRATPRTSASHLSSSRSPLPRSKPTSRPAPRQDLDPQYFFRPTLPSGPPTVNDLNNLRPRRLNIPEIDSPEATRIIYTKTWHRAISSLDRSFNKQQLAALAGDKQGGLNLDYKDVRMKSGKPKKWWVPKKTSAMTKSELMRLVLIMQWGMVDPEKIPAPRKSPRVEDTINLSDRALFLLLSADGTSISSLTRDHEVKLAFARDPATSILSLIIRGSKTAVAAAKEDVEVMSESSSTEGFELPLPATTLRPEVYQLISRLSTTFLEQGSGPNLLVATASNPQSVDKVERLLGQAFVHNSIQSLTPIFASLPNSPITSPSTSTNRYAMFPFTPPITPPWTSKISNSFARVKTISSPTSSSVSSLASTSSHDNNDVEGDEDLNAWSTRMNFERSSRLPLSSQHPTVLAPLRKPFAEGERVDMTVSFGHIVWPLSIGATTGLVPILAGRWPFPKFAGWSQKQKSFQSVFLPSPPTGFLHSTGSLTPKTSDSPFGALLSSQSSTNSAPFVESREFRRIVYRPVALPDEGEGIASIVIEDDGRGAVEAFKLVESRAGMMVPQGSIDFQVSLATKSTLSTDQIIDFDMNAPGELSTYIEHNSISYLLDTDRTIRQTIITPSSSTSSSSVSHSSSNLLSLSSRSSDEIPYSQIQEQWYDNLPLPPSTTSFYPEPRSSTTSSQDSSTRGITVSYLLGSRENVWSEVVGLWKEGVEVMEGVAKRKVEGLGCDSERGVFRARRD